MSKPKFFRKKKGKKTVTKRLKKLEMKVANNAPEIKYFYVANGPANLGAGIQGFVLNGIQQGVAEGQRIGNRIKTRRIQGVLSLQGGSVGGNKVFGRVMIVVDKQNNLTQAFTFGEMVHQFGTPTEETDSIALIEKQFEDRYTILHDRSFYVTTNDTTRGQKYIRWNIAYNALVNYDGSGATAGDQIIDKAVYLIIVLTDGLREMHQNRISYIDN